MSVEAEYAIEDNLRKSDNPMTFPQLKESTDIRGQDLRRGLRRLITDGDVYVAGVKDKEKRYGIK